MADQPILLYSVKTLIAFRIEEIYYDSEHYLWCSPYFDSSSLRYYTLPPSSDPSEIYRSLQRAAAGIDRNCTKIEENKVGILRGAACKREAGVINEEQEQDIATMLVRSEIQDFRPLLCVIPYTPLVDSIAKEIRPASRANPLMVEYLIERLPQKCFDIIAFNV